MIWFKPVDLKQLNDLHKNTMQEFVGIEFIEVGDDYIKAKMPVNERTKQPLGLLHGGANVVLAESLGSIASLLCLNTDEKTCVGLEINANHIRAVREGFVHGITKPIHIGRTTMIWEIKIYDDAGKLTCISRITNAILDKKK
ncbi:MAG: hotdog fold thioesterase [Sphingobacteriales bacterium]|nr:MAG: hotdog fold thioesterase [Sphingobacteriales bacterium]